MSPCHVRWVQQSGKAEEINPKYLINRLIYTRKFAAVGSGLAIHGKVFIHGEGKISVGNNFSLQDGCEIFADKNATVTIGNDVRLNGQVSIIAQKLVEIGDETLIGGRTIIQDTDLHGIDGNRSKTMPIRIGFHVWLARGVTVLKGVTIGDHAIVGACSVVTSNVEANTIVAGNPAKQIGLTKSGYC